MCGHGTIGTVTIAIEKGIVQPKTPGVLRLETPAGLVNINYEREGDRVKSVKLTNVPAYLHSEGLEAECPDLGFLKVDVAYGGNFYAIVDPQENFKGIQDHSAAELIRWSPILRNKLNELYTFQHPDDPTIQGLSHLLWTGDTIDPNSSARNAVF